MENGKVGVLYWGKKGGPVRQIRILLESAQGFEKENIIFFLSDSCIDSANLIRSENPNVVQVPIPKSKASLLFNQNARRRTIRTMMRAIEELNINRIFFLMPHPWDLHLARKLLEKTDVEIWRAVHDFRRHPGDYWPDRRAINQVLDFAHVHVVYSDFVGNFLRKQDKKIIKTTLSEGKLTNSGQITEGSVLFVGRFRKYKGLKLLNDAWPLVKNPKKSLTIAGSGRHIPRGLGKKAKVIKKWLSDAEIERLISSHSVVVCPYIEASQSGIIPIATALGRPVVVTPVGGLKEQIAHGTTGLVSRSVTEVDLAKSIDEALKIEWRIGSLPNSATLEFLHKLTT